MGVGPLAFGATALNFDKRASTVELAATDQEYALAVLWTTARGPTREAARCRRA